MIRFSIILLFVWSTGISCTNTKNDDGNAQEEFIQRENWEYDYRPYLEERLRKTNHLLAPELVSRFYNEEHHGTVWVFKDSLTSAGKAMYAFMDSLYAHGLNPDVYHKTLIDSTLGVLPDELYAAADADILLTDAYFAIASHLHHGMLDSHTLDFQVRTDSLPIDPFKSIASVIGTAKVAEELKKFEPKLSAYQDLQRACNHFMRNFTLSETRFQITSYKSDSTGTYQKAKEALIAHGYADSLILQNDSAFKASLKDFQEFHHMDRDGKIGLNTSRALNMSNLERWKQIAINLEKWRWHKEFPSTRLYVNIPEFHLYYYRNDSLIRLHRVVVGHPSTQTPEFTAKLTYLNVYPFWHVPHSISTNEILPFAKRDSTYLEKNGYSIMTFKGEHVDMSTINLKDYQQNNFPFKIRQNYGYGNALGVVAFMFPNPHDVFIHDTPAKFFFTTGTRAYSHGCVRLQDPVKLARNILTADKNNVNPDTLEVLLAAHTPKMVYLKKRIPIFIEYHTAFSDTLGRLRLPLDIYFRDTAFLSRLDKAFRVQKPLM